ncbi:hypothetical protein PPL_00516 [Heterostelium album PN500]|uniref:Uncharacterized protein n=1 Tax=Heterostelium pallidum (strain ATCC 26659 / Pp 5 / PN500) TaxID=670386 RepID=D3AWP0_HETP5|nr:hypothetical protein PPL_00516 [Heterostelium album PN500]EFA86713.1 hypothetical protein PPL_00516 [Heterostelium album PN500]|eukprot:XP_020438817.1 hypothetical protein PPL_00516 [Heterostelium album PN500]
MGNCVPGDSSPLSVVLDTASRQSLDASAETLIKIVNVLMIVKLVKFDKLTDMISRNSITYCLGTCGRPTPIRSSTPRNIKTQ